MGIKILTVLLLILKILGIALLVILALLLLILLLILFVPVRYKGSGYRTEGDTVPVHVQLKVTWLLHFVRLSFSYPEEAVLKVKVLFFRILPVREKTRSGAVKKKKVKEKASERKTVTEKEPVKSKPAEKVPSAEETAERKTADNRIPDNVTEDEEKRTFADFVRKLLCAVKNIKYTIHKIYDKIKHIICNIRYYTKILQTESFRKAFALCRGQCMKLLKAVLPRKLSASFTVGMEDPAATGQILSAYGILYPLIGDSVTLIPDFENQIIEGSFTFKGKITAFSLIIIAAKVYFDKDLKRVIRLFKKEAVQNGRK